LQDQGYQILHQNFRSRRGEIDLVAMEGDTLCFVEVRYRRRETFGDPGSTVGGLKQHRIIKTAQAFLATAWAGPPCACRFDVVAIVGGTAPEIVLFRNAFEVPGVSF